MIRSTYVVEGMTCGHCVAAVRSEVAAIAGVRSVDVMLATGRVEVESERELALADVAAAVEEAGYRLGAL